LFGSTLQRGVPNGKKEKKAGEEVGRRLERKRGQKKTDNCMSPHAEEKKLIQTPFKKRLQRNVGRL